MTAPPIVVDGFGVLCGTCGAPFAHPDAVDTCNHGPSMIPAIPPGAPLPTAIGPRYQAGPRTYRARPDRDRIRLAANRVLVVVGMVLALGAFGWLAWQAFAAAGPAPGCGRACVPAPITYTHHTPGGEQ